MKIQKVLPTPSELLMKNYTSARKRMEHARSFIKNTRTPKYSNSEIKDMRVMYLASAQVKGITLAIVAAIMRVPVSTLRKIIYNKEYRRHPDAVLTGSESLAPALARLNAIADKHKATVDRMKKERKASEDNTFSTADRFKMARVQASTERREPSDAEQATQGLTIIDREQAMQAARLYLRDRGSFNSASVSALSHKIMVLHNIFM